MSKRSDLKENILAAKVETGLKWILENRIQVLVGIGACIVAGLVSSVFVIRKNELKEVQWAQLTQAQGYLAQKDYDQARQILLDITTKSPKSKVALFSSYYMGEVDLAENKFDLAIEHLLQVVNSKGDSLIKPLAISNLAHAYEQKGDFAMAAETSQSFMTQFEDHFMAPRIQLALGRTLALAGNTDEAKESLGQLVDLYPTSPWADNARRILDKLETR